MKLLITGGCGGVGLKLRKEIGARFERVRILDRIADTLAPNEEGMIGDVADMAAVMAAMDGMDAVIHLAALPVEGSFEEILQSNIVGTYNVYEAAYRKGARRVIFGSSNHAVGFYPRSQRIDTTVAGRPDSRYGLSKCWGEDVGSLYADKYGVKSLHIRIGNAFDYPSSARALAIWVSARDLAQLVMIGLEHADIHNTIVYGVSDNAACWYDNSAAYALGYKPQDRAEDYTEKAMEGEKSVKPDPVAEHFQGGPFCSIEYDGGPIR
jgi:uronate dehydrogenase